MYKMINNIENRSLASGAPFGAIDSRVLASCAAEWKINK
jgi:hypothetical protein